MQLSNHSELITVLTELYTLFDDLGSIEPNILRLPIPDTSVHPASLFDADGAIAAGFTPEAVLVMSALPYLHDGDSSMGGETIEMLGSTYPLNYLGLDEGGFELARDLPNDVCGDGDEKVILPSAFRLTWQHVYGWEYIYGVEKRGIYMWNPMDDEFEYPEDSRKPNYLHLETVPPREAFQPLIDDFRQLRKLAPSAGQTPISTDISSLRGPENFDKKGSLALYEAGRKLWEALCKLKSFYVECGWDDNALVQTEFRRDEFVDNRAKYWDEVVEPLEEESRKASDFYRMKN